MREQRRSRFVQWIPAGLGALVLTVVALVAMTPQSPIVIGLAATQLMGVLLFLFVGHLIGFAVHLDRQQPQPVRVEARHDRRP